MSPRVPKGTSRGRQRSGRRPPARRSETAWPGAGVARPAVRRAAERRSGARALLELAVAAAPLEAACTAR